MWNSDPTLRNVTIFNPDFVGVDLFSGSNPAIDNLTIEVAKTSWNLEHMEIWNWPFCGKQ